MLAWIVVAVLYALGNLMVLAWRETENERVRCANEVRQWRATTGESQVPEVEVSWKVGVLVALCWPAAALYLFATASWDAVQKL